MFKVINVYGNIEFILINKIRVLNTLSILLYSYWAKRKNSLVDVLVHNMLTSTENIQMTMNVKNSRTCENRANILQNKKCTHDL